MTSSNSSPTTSTPDKAVEAHSRLHTQPESPAPRPRTDEASSVPSSPDSSEKEHGEISDSEPIDAAPPLPKEPVPNAPPLPNEAVPPAEDDDGWDYRWDYNAQTYIFFNRKTGAEQLENPRLPSSAVVAAVAVSTTAPATATATATATQPPAPSEDRAISGYNPAIHGDYDPNAWYATQYHEAPSDHEAPHNYSLDADPSDPHATTATFNHFTGQFQTADQGPGRHSDESKAKRQMNAFFDVDAAANAHDGRSLKAERSGKKPTKAELKAFKEKRRAKKEEKRRAWLRD